MRNVIEEDHPQSDAAEEIEPEVTFDDMRESILAGRHAFLVASGSQGRAPGVA
jgi:hypothetical protein